MKTDVIEQDALESRDFYEVCQQYRHSQEFHQEPLLNTVQAFEALKDWIRGHCLVSTPPIGEDHWIDRA